MKKRRINQLLTAGIMAGPIYLGLALVQIALRPDFDVTRHSLSLMSNGELGWIQITNFMVTGLFVIAASFGIRKTIEGTPASKWGTNMLALYGIGLLGAAVFIADPVNGFPAGSPTMNVFTTSGLLHLLSGSIGFIGLIAACFIFAKRFYKLKEKNWGHFSLATGSIFLAAFVGIASGSQPNSSFLTQVTLGFWAAVIISFIWISLLSAKLKKN